MYGFQIVNIKSADPNKINADWKSYKNICIYYVTVSYVTQSSVKPFLGKFLR